MAGSGSRWIAMTRISDIILATYEPEPGADSDQDADQV